MNKLLVVLTIATFLLNLGPAGAAQGNAPVDRPTKPPAPPEVCPIAVRVFPVPGHADEALFTLWSDGAAGISSGAMTIYQANKRYKIPFTNALAADLRSTAHPPTPIVIQFPDAVPVDSAYVSALDGTDCPIHSPYVAHTTNSVAHDYFANPPFVYANWGSIWPAYVANAATLATVTATGGEPAPAPTCAAPYVAAHPINANDIYENHHSGTRTFVAVRVQIAKDGAMGELRLDRSSNIRKDDDIAINFVARSDYAPEIYRCQPVSDNYLYVVDYDDSDNLYQ